MDLHSKNVQDRQASIIGKAKFVTFLQRHTVFHELYEECFRFRFDAMKADRLSITNVAEHILPCKPKDVMVCIDLVAPGLPEFLEMLTETFPPNAAARAGPYLAPTERYVLALRDQIKPLFDVRLNRVVEEDQESFRR